MGGGLVAFCYIEQLGALLLRKRKKTEGDWHYSAAFIRTYMPDFAKAIREDFVALKGVKEPDAFREFIREFRNGLVHCYFPKAIGWLQTINQYSATNPFLWKDPEYGGVVVNLLKLRESFRSGALQYADDVVKNVVIHYQGKNILVRDNCIKVLNKWIPHDQIVDKT